VTDPGADRTERRKLDLVQRHFQMRIERWYERLTLFRALRTVLSIALLLVVVAGLLARLVEPQTFTSVGLSYWWAVTTVTTVGYGDIVPHTVPGRIIGAALMLLGVSLIPTLTSVIVSTLVSKRNRSTVDRLEEERRELAAALGRLEEALARREPLTPTR
jgi:voltage-gated potassium channel Kch